MADVSQVNLPDGSLFNVKDAVARSTKADKVSAPAEYDPTVTYNAGDICTHEGNIYYCYYLTATGPWDANKWNILPTQQQDYLHSVNPVGVGSFSLNRAIGTTVGSFSFAEGLENNSSGYAAHAEGFHTRASGSGSHAEGSDTYSSGNNAHAEGSGTSAGGNMTHAEGGNTSAAGIMSHTEGYYTKAKYRCQHVFGEYNVEDPSTETNLNNRGNYVEIVGNGTANNARSNARTLDWDGNEVLAGGLKINGTQNVATQVSLTQAEYDALVQAGTVDLVNTVYFITDGNANANSASETTYDNTSSGLTATNVQGAIDEVVSEKADQSTTYTKTQVDSMFTATTEWKTSTTSFVSACSLINIYNGIGNVLDNLKTNISSYTTNSINTRVDSTQGPVYFMWFGKASDNYFTGMLLSYFGNNEPSRKSVLFSYFNGTYQVRLI